MKQILIFLLVVFNYSSLLGQNSYMLGNAQVNSMLNKKTVPSEVGFQFSSKVSISVQIPVYVDTLADKEVVSLEIGGGNLFNSLYFKNSNQSNPRNSADMNMVNGFFFNLEPHFTLYQNKAKTFFFHASFNNVFYLFDNYISTTGYNDRDSNEIKLTTTNAKNNLQYAIEPYLGISYLLKFRNNGGLLLRLKRGYVFHNQPIAIMSLSNSNEVSAIKINNNSWIFSMGLLLSTKK